MSSLAAARADNFYYPPNYDPAKHGSLNQFNGQHPLRDRARKLDEGILVIRFEVPFNIWCNTCGEHIAKGVRFNAEKKQVGTYFSTKVWSFTMRHHCGCKITITTDPKNAEYLVTDGARRKIETYDPDDAQTIELPDANERAAVASDPLASLERTTLQARQAASWRAQLVAIAADREAKGKDPYSLNKTLRTAMRQARRRDAALDVERRTLGLSEDVRLLPASEADAVAAQVALNQQSGIKYQDSHQNKRQKIISESIFGAAAPPAQLLPSGPRSSGAGARAGNGSSRAPGSSIPHPPQQPKSSSRSGLAALAGAAAGGGSRSAALQKQQLQQRVLLAKRRKQG